MRRYSSATSTENRTSSPSRPGAGIAYGSPPTRSRTHTGVAEHDCERRLAAHAHRATGGVVAEHQALAARIRDFGPALLLERELERNRNRRCGALVSLGGCWFGRVIARRNEVGARVARRRDKSRRRGCRFRRRRRQRGRRLGTFRRALRARLRRRRYRCSGRLRLATGQRQRGEVAAVPPPRRARRRQRAIRSPRRPTTVICRSSCSLIVRLG